MEQLTVGLGPLAETAGEEGRDDPDDEHDDRPNGGVSASHVLMRTPARAISGDDPVAARDANRQAGVMTALKRPKSGRIIAGVCAAIASRYGWSANAVRLVFILSCLLPGPQFLIYIALWIFVPAEK